MPVVHCAGCGALTNTVASDSAATGGMALRCFMCRVDDRPARRCGYDPRDPVRQFYDANLANGGAHARAASEPGWP